MVEPRNASEEQTSEVVRAFIANGALEVHLQRAFDDPAVWGILLADIARHAARVFESEGVCSEDDALESIQSMFEAELDAPTDEGTTEPNQ